MNATRDGAKLVEFLHLAFLQVLPTRLPVADYVVKGGANLRLFFDSRRRSQDIDLDSRAFNDLLRVQGVQVMGLAKTKQTDTTRRWKFAVRSNGAWLNGRPPLSVDAEAHSPRIAVRVPADLHRRVHEKAGAEGRNVSEVLRELLEGYAGHPRPSERLRGLGKEAWRGVDPVRHVRQLRDEGDGTVSPRRKRSAATGR